MIDSSTLWEKAYEEIVDLYQLREWIELAALPGAMKNLGPADIGKLEQSCCEIRRLGGELSDTKETFPQVSCFKKEFNEADLYAPKFFK